MTSIVFELRPTVSHPDLWNPQRPSNAVWNKIRKQVLERDKYTCMSCGHRALKWMNIHHIEESDSDEVENLRTLCPACHAVLHMGRSLNFGKIEIWKTSQSQVDLVRATREGVRDGRTLAEINASFDLKRGRLRPDSVDWANDLIKKIGNKLHAELPQPLCAVFVDFTQWQIE